MAPSNRDIENQQTEIPLRPRNKDKDEHWKKIFDKVRETLKKFSASKNYPININCSMTLTRMATSTSVS